MFFKHVYILLNWCKAVNVDMLFLFAESLNHPIANRENIFASIFCLNLSYLVGICSVCARHAASKKGHFTVPSTCLNWRVDDKSKITWS